MAAERGAGHGPARTMKWWGWGAEGHEPRLPTHALAMLRSELGLGAVRREPVDPGAVRLPEPALPERARERLLAVVGDIGLREDREARLVHAAGKSYPDLVRQRAGEPLGAPDAVVSPASHAEVRAVLEACGAAEVAVVPFGGGTSVVGGLEPRPGRFAATISLDLGRLDRLLAVDERSLVASFEPGIRGPEAEALLERRGLTLGHFPQSHEYVSLGGCVATRSAGQASAGYGRIDELLVGARLAAPAGEIDLQPMPASAAGPELRQLIAGSEGVLGVLTRVDLRVRPRPAMRRYEGWFFRSFAEGVEAFRRLAQLRAAPDVARLSDEEETRLTMALAGGGGVKGQIGRLYLGARGYAGGCVVIVGWEGTRDDVDRRRARGSALLRAAGGLSLGRGPGEAWLEGRFAAPYLRDDMLGHGVLVETLETATTWSRLDGLYAAVGRALRDSLAGQGTPPLVMCHVSHVYEAGASLYFTFLARQREGEEIAQWRAAKAAACDAIVAAGGTITHHHAVGRDHAPWMEAEIGRLGVDVLRAAKARLDPEGIMNPGKLLP